MTASLVTCSRPVRAAVVLVWLVLVLLTLHLARGLSAGAAAISARATGPSAPDERGSFLLYKLQRLVGEETYIFEKLPDGRGLRASSEWKFLDRNVRLATELDLAGDWTPRRFEIAGATSTMTRISARVEVHGENAHVRLGDITWRRAVSERFFTATHYPPPSLTMALLRRWVSSGRPERIALLPRGEVRLQWTGADTIAHASRRVVLQRYNVEGLIWGGLAVWVDSAGDLVATVGADAELDRFEAVRAGFEGALPSFVRGAIRDGLDRMQRIARDVPPVRDGRFALVGARLIDGTGGPVLEDATILVRDGRIAAAGPRARTPIPAGTPVVDAGGRSVIPGLWDMHGHYEQVEWAPAGLAAGVTTVRDAANEFELVVALRDAIDAGRALGPRILPAGVIDGGSEPLGVITADTPEQAREAVRRYHEAGFPQVKIYQSLDPSLVGVVAEEAHRLGMTVTGHVPTGMDALEFVAAGADQINHLGFVATVVRPEGSPMADSALALLIRRGTVVEPSLARGEQWGHPNDQPFSAFEPGTAFAPLPLRETLDATGRSPERAGDFERVRRWAGEFVARLHRAGVPIVLGTDLGVPGHTMHREMELAVAGGLTPMEAIGAATAVAARAMGQEAESGTVEPGKRADLVVLDGDPLADIRAVREVVWVVARGRLFEAGPLWRSVGFEAPR